MDGGLCGLLSVKACAIQEKAAPAAAAPCRGQRKSLSCVPACGRSLRAALDFAHGARRAPPRHHSVVLAQRAASTELPAGRRRAPPGSPGSSGRPRADGPQDSPQAPASPEPTVVWKEDASWTVDRRRRSSGSHERGQDAAEAAPPGEPVSGDPSAAPAGTPLGLREQALELDDEQLALGEWEVALPDANALADEQSDRSDGGASDDLDGAESEDDAPEEAQACAEGPEDGEEEPEAEEARAADAAPAEEDQPCLDGRSRKKRKRKRKRKTKKKDTQEQAGQPQQRARKPPVPSFSRPKILQAVRQELALLPEDPAASVTAKKAPVLLASTRPRVVARDHMEKHLLVGKFVKRPAKAVEADSDAADSEAERTAQARAQSAATLRAHGAESGGVRATRSAGSASPPHGASPSRDPRRRPPRLPGDAAAGEAAGPLSVVGQAPKPGHQAQATRRPAPAPAKLQRTDEVDHGLHSLYFSFGSMKDKKGNKVPLMNRDQVVQILHDLNTKVATPICRFFRLRYNFFSEHHCQAKKAGVTVKDPLVLRKRDAQGEVIHEERRDLVTIRLRLRVHPTKGDPQTQFISRGTQLAVLLHELCHLRHMNHGKDFMLFLRDIFAHARKLGVFDPANMSNEIPSPWPWENEIFRAGGEVDDAELLRIFKEHREAQGSRAPSAAGGRTSASAEAAEAALGEAGAAGDEPEGSGAEASDEAPAEAEGPGRGAKSPGRARSPGLSIGLVSAFGAGMCCALEGCADELCQPAPAGPEPADLGAGAVSRGVERLNADVSQESALEVLTRATLLFAAANVREAEAARAEGAGPEARAATPSSRDGGAQSRGSCSPQVKLPAIVPAAVPPPPPPFRHVAENLVLPPIGVATA